MCDRVVRSIFLLPLVARCLETIDVCIWYMIVFMSVLVTEYKIALIFFRVWGRMQVVLSGFSVILFCFVQEKNCM